MLLITGQKISNFYKTQLRKHIHCMNVKKNTVTLC
jgi:hypothetical protein